MGHADALAHHKPLDLMEHGRVGNVAVATVDLAGGDHSQRRLARQHGAGLHGRGVRAHEHLFGNIQGILHVAGGVFGRHVESFKIVVVDFHFGAGGHVKAQALKNLADFFGHQGGGVQAAAPGRATRHRGVKTAQGLGFTPGFKGCLAGFKQGIAAFFDAVGSLAHGGALCGSKRRQLGHDLGYAALATQNIHAQSLKGIQRRSLAQTFFKFRNQAFQCRNQIHSGYPNAARRGFC